MYKMLINGQMVEGKGELFDVCNPATGEVIESVRAASIEQAEEALQAAQEAFKTWSKTSINERQAWMRKLKEAFAAEKDNLAQILWEETGKNKGEAAGEIGLLGDYIDFYGEEVKRVYGVGVPECAVPSGTMHVVEKRPVGVVVGHVAWNAPVGNLATKLPPALASGCTCVLKPSTSTPLASLKIAEIIAKSGLPKGVVNILTGPSSTVGNYLSASPIPRLITVVGSTAAGKEVMRQGSSSIKKYSLELGGNAPCIIMPDADLDYMATYVTQRKIGCCGQLCASINRIFVHESIHDEFVEKLAVAVAKVKVGWGEDMPTHMGSMINIPARDRVLRLIDDSIKMGAKLVYGGGVPEMPEHLKNGAFIMPTILDQVTDDMPVVAEESFGPVFPVMTFKDIDEVIERANNTDLGLSAYLFTHDSRAIGKFGEGIEGGEVRVNYTGMATNLPHIGNKQSGVGCDRGLWSLEEYFDIRKISIKW